MKSEARMAETKAMERVIASGDHVRPGHLVTWGQGVQAGWSARRDYSQAELEPMLDLIEELIDAARYAPDFFVEKWGIDKTVEQAEAILRAHGRLSEEEGKGQ